MEKEDLLELNEIREEQGIDIDIFEEVLTKAIKYQMDSVDLISDQEVKEIIIETLCRIDYRDFNRIDGYLKSLDESFEDALRVLGYKKTK